ncbi:MAG: helix-turn-helix domain-containing protein [Candidatus Shapirobacteria bacterium]|jgi:sugar-specific transcriptional regulator TrmB
MIEKDKIKSELKTVFQYLKLDDKSADFYLNCLVNGKTTINQISKNIGVARSTCYLILERLKFLGLVMETPFGKKRSLVAQNPDKLIDLLKEEKEKSENAFNLAKEFLPQIKLYSTVDLNSKVRFYEGLESIKQIYNETLEAKQILVFCLTQIINSEFEKFIDNYEKRLIQKGIETNEIVTDSKWDLEYIKKYSTKLNTIISIPRENSTDTDYMLWDNKVAFISFKKGRFTGVVIEDQEITNFERMRFNLLWRFLVGRGW